MKRSALFKDFYREILRNKGRFVSIFLIVTLGVAFFSGIRAAEPDMRMTGDRYFDELDLYDGYAAGTLGITDDDLAALQELPLLEKVYGEHSIDVLSEFEGRARVLRVSGIQNGVNTLHVEMGRLPEKEDEIVLDAALMPQEVGFKGGGGLGLGDTITLESGTDDDLLETLKETTFTIVGYVSSPRYFSFGRGTTTIGTGDVYAFACVKDSVFETDYYSYAYYTVKDAKGLNAFQDPYLELLEEASAQVESIEDIRCEARYDETYGEGMRELNDAKAELADARKKLSDGEKELKDAKKEVKDGKKKLDDAQKTLDSSRSQAYRAFADSLAQLQSVQETLRNGRKELENGKQQIKDLEKQLEEQQKLLEEITVQVEQGKEALAMMDDGLSQLQAGLSQIDAGIAQIDAGMPALEGAVSQLQGADAQITQQLADPQISEEERAALTAQQSEIQAQLAPLQAQMSSLEVQKQDLLGQKQELQRQIDELQMQRQSVASQVAEGEAGIEQLKTGNAMIEGMLPEAKEQLEASEAQLIDGENEAAKGWDTYHSKKAETEEKLSDAQKEIDSNREKLKDGEKEIAENEEKLADGYKEVEENEEKVADAEEKLEKIHYPEWYIMDRMDDTDYSGFNDNALRMAKIGRVFPVIFFLLAALISLTTMTRMVEEERIQIGTLKALGYSRFAIASKFVGYAGLATVLGSALGMVFGEKTLPYIIIHAYTIMYPHLTEFLLPLNWYYGLMAGIAAVVSVLAATLYSCWKTLQEVPAELMLPPSPQVGKRIFAERIGLLWKHLNFSWKATIRNLSRYKKRLWMTVIGIGGCMALLMAGFGLRDSIMEVVTLQYVEIQQYDLDVYVKNDASAEEIRDVEARLTDTVGKDNYLRVAMKKTDVRHDDISWEMYLLVPQDPSRIDEFVHFRSRLGHEEYSLNDEGVILTEKAASLLNVKAGDTISLDITDEKQADAQVLAVTENYMSHYAYMTPALYSSLAGEEPVYNDYMVNTGDAGEEENEAIGEKLLECDAVMNISYLISLRSRLDTMLSTLDDVIIVLIIAAGMLAFVVLYNLNNINITERRREMATLKVLGFYDMEVAMYVYRENIFMTLYGILAGLIMGRFLHMFLITTVEVDQVMFGRHMFAASYVYSVLITVLFAGFVNWIMYYKLRKIDMVESLKSVE